MTARSEQGRVPLQTLLDLQDEVHALWEFERDLFHKAFPSVPRPSEYHLGIHVY